MLAAAVGAALTPVSVRAVTDTWTGSQGPGWDNALNWSQGAKPQNSWEVLFPTLIPGTGSAINLGSAEQAASITFDNSYSLSGGSLSLATGQFTVASGATATIASQLTGTGGLTKLGNGTIVLSGTNTNNYTGSTTISAGNVIVNTTVGTVFGSGGGPITMNPTGAASAGLLLNGGVNLSRSIVVSGAGSVALGANTAGSTFSGNINLGNSLTLSALGLRTLTVSGNISDSIQPSGVTVSGGGNVILTGNNSYSAGTTINNGALRISADTNLGASSGGITHVGGVITTTASFSMNRPVTLAGASGSFVSVNPGTNLTMAGVINGMGVMFKAGTGTLSLTGASNNTYTQTTDISSGTLALGKSNNVNAVGGDVVVNNNTTLLWLANEQIPDTAALTLNSGGTLNLAGHTETVSSFTDNGGTTILGGGGIYIASGDLNLTDNTVIATNVGVSGNINYTGTTSPATISGNITLSSNPTSHDLNVSDGASSTDVLISGSISGSSGLNKIGNGTVRLAGGNSSVSTFSIDGGHAVLASGTLAETGNLIGGSSSGNQTFTQSGGIHNVGANVFLGNGASGNTTYNLSGGTLSVVSSLALGVFGTGNLNQTGGVVIANQLQIGRVSGGGIYTISAGDAPLGSGGIIIADGASGARGTVVQSGGFISTTGSLTIANTAGNAGTYQLSGGWLNPAKAYIGGSGTGTFSQSGGSHIVTGALYVGNNGGASGNYLLSGGILNAGGEAQIGYAGVATLAQTGGVATFNNGLTLGATSGGAGYVDQSGGTITVSGGRMRLGTVANSIGSYTLSGTGHLFTQNEDVGYSGSGTFTQTGGTHTISSDLVLANSLGPGLYTLSDGALNAGGEFVGGGPVYLNHATFAQSGGVNTTGTLGIGGSGGSAGLFSLSGGTLSVSNNLTMGISSQPSSGETTFTQTGGTASIGGNMLVGATAPSASVASISDGTLSAGNIYLGGNATTTGGDATFSVSGSGSVSTNQLKLWNHANVQLNFSGGAITAGTLDLGGAPSRLNWTGGTLNLTGPNVTLQSGAALGQSLTVGANCTLNAAGDGETSWKIGDSGAGALNVVNGGAASIGEQIYIGNSSGGNGTLSVTGTGSALNTPNSIVVGRNGTGTVSIGSNAIISSVVTSVAEFSGSTGSASVSGTWNNEGGFSIGGRYDTSGGTGSVTINSGGHLDVGQVLKLWNSAGSGLTVSSGGTVTAKSVDINGGTNTVAAGASFTVGSAGLLFSGNFSPTITLAADTTAPAVLNLGGDLTMSATPGSGAISSSPGPGQLAGIVDLKGGTRNFIIANSPNLRDLEVSARITNGSIIKSGLGSLYISTPSDYSGSTDISAGAIILGGANVLPATTDLTGSAGAVLNMGGYSQTLGSLGGAEDVALGSTATTTLTVGGSAASTTFSGGISGSGTLVKEGAGTMLASGVLSFSQGLTVNNGTLILSGVNSFGGSGKSINLNGSPANFGTISVASDEALGNSGNSLQFAGGHFQATASFASNRGISLNQGNGTIDVLTGQTFTALFSISGSGGLNKIGGGTFRLNSLGTYTGNTNLLEGTILESPNNSNRLPSGTVLFMANGSTLDMSGNAQSIATLMGDGTIALGGGTFTTGSGDSSTAFAGTIGGGGAVVKNGLGAIYLTGNSSFTGGLTASGGEVALSGTGNSFGGNISIATTGIVSANSEAALGSAANVINLGGTFAATGSYTTSHVFQLANLLPTIAVNSGEVFTIASNVTGTVALGGQVHKVGGGTLAATTALSMTPFFFNIDAGTFSLGENGAATGISSQIAVLTGASLQLDNTTANNANRIGNSTALAVNGGTFRFLGKDGVSSTESLGSLTVNAGASTISLIEGSGGTNTVSFSGLSAIISQPTVNFVGNSLGATNKVFISGLSNGFIGARYTMNGTDFIDYDATNGIVAATYATTFTSGARVLLDADATAPASSIRTLSLNATNNAVNVTQSGPISVDGILSFGSNTASISGSTLSNRTNNYLYIHAHGGEVTVNSALKNGTAGSMALVKSGPGTVILTSTDSTNHNISGGFYLNDGTIQISSDANLGATAGNVSDVNFYGGTLATTAPLSLTGNRQFFFNPNGGAINVVGSGNTLTSAVANQLSGSNSSWFTKTGTGTFFLTGGNNFKGPVNVAAGTLELGSTAALGATGPTWSTITLNPSASLTLRTDGPYPADFHSDVVVTNQQINDPVATINTERFSAGTGGAYQLGGLKIGNGTLVNSGATGRLQFTKTVVLNGNATFSNARDLILTGQVTGTGTLTKSGSANMVLGADPNDVAALADTKNNTYLGLTTISQGTLYLNKQPGVNAISGDINMDGGKLILLQPRQIADTSKITLTGGLVDVNGKTDTINNLNAGGSSNVKVAGGGSLITKDTSIGGSATLTISTPVGGSLKPGGGKFGGGSDLQTVDSGTFYADSMDVANENVLVNPGGTLSVGPHGLQFSGTGNPKVVLASNSTTPGKTLLGGNVAFTGASGTAEFQNSGTPPTAGTVDLGGYTRTFSVTNASATLVLNGARVINGSLRKEGPGTLRLTTDSDFTGGLVLAQGTLEATGSGALGKGAVSLSNTPALRLLSDATVATFPNDLRTASASLTIGPSLGTATNTFQFNRLSMSEGQLDVSGASTGKLEFVGDSVLSGDVTFNTQPTLQFSGAISGAYAITKSTGAGTMVFAGGTPNTHSGLTKIQAGVLELNKTSGVAAVGGDLTTQNGTVRWSKDEQVPNTSNLATLTKDSLFDLNGRVETINNLNMTAGTLQTGTGTLTVQGNITASASAFAATVSGRLNLPTLSTGSHTLTVNNAVGTTTLNVPANLLGAGAVNKGGAGTLNLSGDNAKYTGMVTVNGGRVNVASQSAMVNLTLAGGTLGTSAAINGTRGISITGSATVDTGNFSSTLSTLSGAGTLTKAGAGKLTSNSVALGGLVVNAGTVSVSPRAGASGKLVRISALTINPNAALDLNDNHLVVANGDFATIQGLVFQGYRDSADATATGIISTTGQTTLGHPILAVFDNSVLQTSEWPFGSGQTVSTSSVLGQYAYLGDGDLNGMVTPDDYGAVDSNLGSTPGFDGGMNWFAGDWNIDGAITPDDYSAIDANLGLGQGGAGGPPLGAVGTRLRATGAVALMSANGTIAIGGGVAAVPEPSGVALVVAGCGALLRRSRRARKSVTRR